VTISADGTFGGPATSDTEIRLVGSFYDLTIVVINSGKLTYIFTPVGVAPAAALS
jgi:hypothetical protein